MLQPRYKDDALVEAGIDEAGRGCLWGPLIAAAVIWPPEASWTAEQRITSEQIKDSKKISPKKRRKLREEIEKMAVAFAVGRVEAKEIDEIGMTMANKMAFQRAVRYLSIEPDRLLIDGILSLETAKEQVVEPEADNKYIAVAAASILAKEAHDDIIEAFCMIDATLAEHYDILSCKGYGTKKHRDGILKHGKDVQHRRLFLRKLLGEEHVCGGNSDTYMFVEDD
jgi:ribonuclease HII